LDRFTNGRRNLKRNKRSKRFIWIW
jgi:hypothetical protein